MKSFRFVALIIAFASASNAQAASQKVCTIWIPYFNGTNEVHNLPAPPNWSVFTCAVRAQQLAAEYGLQSWNSVRYRVECLLDAGDPNVASSRGPIAIPNTTTAPPPVNCGWY